MDTIIEFNSFGLHTNTICVVVSQVECFWQIDYNGNYGVEIQLRSGKTVKVSGWLHEVKAKLDKMLVTGEASQ